MIAKPVLFACQFAFALIAPSAAHAQRIEGAPYIIEPIVFVKPEGEFDSVYPSLEDEKKLL